MAITELPTPPSRSTPSTFSTLADAFIAALPVFVTEANATAAAMDLNDTTANSVTSVAIGTGAKNLTVDVSKSYQPGMSVKIARTSSPSNWMHGDVTSYNSGTGALVVNVLAIFGSGTFTDWTITLSAPGSGNVVSDANIVANGLVIGDNGAKGVKELALGTALQVLRMNAGATLPEWTSASIPVGEKILFYKNTAVTGYSLLNTLDDKVVYVTKGSAAGGQTGGAVHSAGTWTQPNHTHTGPSHTHTGPSHTHSVPSGGISVRTGTDSNYCMANQSGTANHLYGIVTGAGGTGATGAAGTGNTGSKATTNAWRPAAYNFTMQQRI